jgi:hypothetical protein
MSTSSILDSCLASFLNLSSTVAQCLARFAVAAVVSLRAPPIVRFSLDFGKSMGGGYTAGAIKVGAGFVAGGC